MYSSIIFKNGACVWLTQEEADKVVHALLNGYAFFMIDRLQQTWNATEVAYCGINSVLMHDKVRGGEFRFTSQNLYAMKDGYEWVFNKGAWRNSKGYFEKALPFADFIATQTVAPVTPQE